MNRIYSGLCIVPISRKKKDEGEVSDIINVPYLDLIIRYADRNRYAVMYLSKTVGLVYYDSYIRYETDRVSNIELWSSIVAEQVLRQCLDMGVSKVELMNLNRVGFNELITKIKRKGIVVKNPIQGYREDILNILLS